MEGISSDHDNDKILNLYQSIVKDAKNEYMVYGDPDGDFIQNEGIRAANSLPTGFQQHSSLSLIQSLKIEECWLMCKLSYGNFEKYIKELLLLTETLVPVEMFIKKKGKEYKQNISKLVLITKSILLGWKDFQEMDIVISWAVHDTFNFSLKRFKKLYIMEKKNGRENELKSLRRELYNLDNSLYEIANSRYKEIRENCKTILTNTEKLFEESFGLSAEEVYENYSNGIRDAGLSDNHNGESYDVYHLDMANIDDESSFNDGFQDSHDYDNYNENQCKQGRIEFQELAAGSKRIRKTKTIIQKYEEGIIHSTREFDSNKYDENSTKKPRTVNYQVIIVVINMLDLSYCKF
jgi:hypothetical protein